MELADLDSEDRLRLVRFVCSFAWADLEIADAERTFVAKLVRQLGLSPEEEQQAEAWMKVPPRPEEIDPTDIPREHRQLFLNQALQMVGADGIVDPNEVETFALFEQLLR